MVMQQQKLKYWGGNYDAYVKTRTEQATNQIKLYKKQQVEIDEIKLFISSCGTYANLVRQAKSRQKILDKMEADGLLEMPYEEPIFRFKFADAGAMAPPLISFSEVAFSVSYYFVLCCVLLYSISYVIIHVSLSRPCCTSFLNTSSSKYKSYY